MISQINSRYARLVFNNNTADSFYEIAEIYIGTAYTFLEGFDWKSQKWIERKKLHAITLAGNARGILLSERNVWQVSFSHLDNTAKAVIQTAFDYCQNIRPLFMNFDSIKGYETYLIEFDPEIERLPWDKDEDIPGRTWILNDILLKEVK